MQMEIPAMLARLQEAVLRAVQRGGPDVRANDVQEAVSRLLGKEQAFGSIFTTLDRLGAKGMVEHRKGEPDNKRGGRAPRLYTIKGEGIAALNEATRINYALHASSGVSASGDEVSERGSVSHG